MTAKKVAHYILSLPEEYQNKEPMLEFCIKLPNGQIFEQQAGIEQFVGMLEDELMTPSGVHPRSEVENYYNIYRAEVAAGIADESVTCEAFNPEACPVILPKGVLVLKAVQSIMSESVQNGIYEAIHAEKQAKESNKLITILDVDLQLGKLLMVLLKAWENKSLPFTRESLEQVYACIVDIKNRHATHTEILQILEAVNSSLTASEKETRMFANPEQTDFPKTTLGKYGFLLGMVEASMDLKWLPKDSDFLFGVRQMLTGNAHDKTEQVVLERINAYLNTPPTPTLTITR